MRIQLSTTSGIPLYLQIVEGMLELLASGALPAGSQVPSSRAFAAELRVNYHTVNRAYQQLERAGFLARQRGEPYRVPVGAPAQAAQQLLSQVMEQLCARARKLGLDEQALLDQLRATYRRTGAAEESA